MNKKGFMITVGGIMLTFLILIIVMVFLGGAAALSLSSIPAPIWIILAFILILNLLGGKKK